jgi:hypothetical protein
MFAGENSCNEGDSDEKPIQLQGDTAEDFAAFLSMPCMYGQFQHHLDRLFLYTTIAMNRPHEILAEMGRTEIKRFCQCARIAHKYQFQSIEGWTLKVLLQSFESSPLPNPQSLVMLAEVAVLCNHTGLFNLTKHALRISLRNENNCSLIINLAERLNFRDIKGLAYHAMMLRGREVWEVDPFLTRDQRIRLFTGLYKVLHLQQVGTTQRPSLPPCKSPTGNCDRRWQNFWSRTIGSERLNRFSDDRAWTLWQRGGLLGELLYAEGVIERIWHSGSKPSDIAAMCETCVNAIPSAVESVLVYAPFPLRYIPQIPLQHVRPTSTTLRLSPCPLASTVQTQKEILARDRACARNLLAGSHPYGPVAFRDGHPTFKPLVTP